MGKMQRGPNDLARPPVVPPPAPPLPPKPAPTDDDKPTPALDDAPDDTEEPN